MLIPLFQNKDTAVQFCAAGNTVYHQFVRQVCDKEIRTVTWLQLLTVIPGRRHGLGPHDLSEKEESNIFGMITS